MGEVRQDDGKFGHFRHLNSGSGRSSRIVRPRAVHHDGSACRLGLVENVKGSYAHIKNAGDLANVG
jgi:hypothetical protein